jgi:subtilisin-like proprotein convertase family protein
MIMNHSAYHKPILSLLITGVMCVLFCAPSGMTHGKSDFAARDPLAKSAPHDILRHPPSLSRASLDEAIISEGFNGSTFPPQGWTEIEQNTNHYTYSWYRNIWDPQEGEGYASVQWDSLLVPQDERLISPAIDLSVEADSLKLSFYFLMSYDWAVTENTYNLEVRISTDGGTNWLPEVLWVEDSAGVFENWVWYPATVDLSDYAGNPNVKIAFRYVGVNGAEASLDFVTVDAIIINQNFRVYSSDSTSVAVPDTSTSEKQLTVIDDNTIADLDVTVNVTHTWVSDLSLWLRSPSGDTVQLISSPEIEAPSGENLVNTKFDDEASNTFAYVEGTSNYTGSWKPFEPLNDFDGESTAGVWSLIATDTDSGDVGSIDNFTLYITIESNDAGDFIPLLPTSVAFHGCYPNPFNPTSTLSFDLSKSSLVRLQLFNALGQQVATLIDGSMNAGSHEILFDGSSFASGTYFAVLRAGDFVEAHKIVLLK